MTSPAACSASRETVGGGLERLVAGEPAALVLEPPRALLALALGALGEPLLGLDRGLDLRAPLGARPLVGRGAALLDDPARVALGLGGLVAGARGLTGLAVDRVARRVGLGDLGLRGFDLRLRRPLGLGRDLDLLDQRVAPVALGEHAVGAAGRDLAQLARGGRPDAPVLGHGDAGEGGVEPVDATRRPRRRRGRRRRGAGRRRRRWA